MSDDFWNYLQRLVEMSEITIDRPRGSSHIRYPGSSYPVDYGYLQGTTTADQGGVDIWIGSLSQRRVVGALCTVDLLKKDTELKIVYDCNEAEMLSILGFINYNDMRAILIRREYGK